MNLKQFYSNLLHLHQDRLKSLRYRYDQKRLNWGQLMASFNAEERAWKDTMPELSLLYSYFEEIPVGDLSPEEVSQYSNQSCPLYSIIKYRDQIIPVYNDDYGQQMYAVFRGRELSGGSYNFNYIDAFLPTVDEMLDRELISQSN